jgi:hypothetical protein
MVIRGVASVTHQKVFNTFFYYFYAKLLWRAVHVLFGISPPHSIDDLFNRWTKTGGNKHNSLLLTVASTLCWAVWITRNEVVFDKCRPKSFLQGLFRGAHWLCQWARLQHCNDQRDQLILTGHHLETSALHFFVPKGGCQIGLLISFSQKLYFVHLCGWL